MPSTGPSRPDQPRLADGHSDRREARPGFVGRVFRALRHHEEIGCGMSFSGVLFESSIARTGSRWLRERTFAADAASTPFRNPRTGRGIGACWVFESYHGSLATSNRPTHFSLRYSNAGTPPLGAAFQSANCERVRSGSRWCSTLHRENSVGERGLHVRQILRRNQNGRDLGLLFDLFTAQVLERDIE